MSTKDRRQSGFSAVELTVVIIVVGITTAMVVPAFTKLGHTNDLENSASQFATHMRLARDKAVTEAMPHIVVWNVGSESYRIVRDNDMDGAPDNGEPTLGPFVFPNQIDLENATSGGFGGSQVIFLPNGTASESGAVVITNAEGLARRVALLAPTGRVKVF